MKRALVTGGAGFLGAFIVRELLAEGHAVRVLALPGETRAGIAGLDVEVLEGDVRDVATCKRAVEGVSLVVHAAAIYADWAPDPTAMYDVAIRGTFHVLEAARRASVDTVVLTASVVAIGRPARGEIADESTPYEAWDLDFPYSRSKLYQRMLAESFAEWDLDVRVVCPGIVLGPGDLRPTPSGKLIVNAATVAAPPVTVEGGGSYVDVRDAARAHVLAATRGRAGERYIATAHDLDNRAFFRAIDEALGRRRRYVKIPAAAARATAMAFEARARRTGEAPLLSRDFLDYSLVPMRFSNAKARRELGATFRPIEDTLRDAVEDFRARGVIPR
jgi:dihydroflavonol-4-reductase